MGLFLFLCLCMSAVQVVAQTNDACGTIGPSEDIRNVLFNQNNGVSAANDLQQAKSDDLATSFAAAWAGEDDASNPRLLATDVQNDSASETQSQQAPSNNPQAPTLEDLGLAPSQTQSNPELQARLDRRTHMLKMHQRLALITTIPMIATVATSFGAGGRATSSSDRWAHMALGTATTGMYFTSAYFAVFAPRIPGTKARGPIRVHKTLAWVHGTGMILTPILGAIAFDQKSKGERVHGIASAHGPVAIITAGAYGAALLSVSVKW